MWSDGPLVIGIPWLPSATTIRKGADLAQRLNVHLVCAFVDPESYLTEWGPAESLLGISLDPAPKEDAEFPSSAVLDKHQDLLGPPGQDWSFRVLHGDVPRALTRLAESTAASMLMVGGPRHGRLAGIARLLEGSISMSLIRLQPRPVVVVPHNDS
jgi:nucleotide-binding universal stress UspA family protein